MQLLASTNKARVWRDGDDIVRKEYYNRARAIKEYESLQQLEQIMGEGIVLDGWRYGVAECRDFDKESRVIRMSFAKGSPLSNLGRQSIQWVEHAGVWLGIYHDRARIDQSKVQLVSDVNLTNFLVDKNAQVVTFVDPGVHFGERGRPETDVLTGIGSALGFSLRWRVLPGATIKQFLRGYFHGGGSVEITPQLLDEILHEGLWQFRRKAQDRRGIKGLKAWWKLRVLKGYLSWRLPRLVRLSRCRTGQ